MHAMTLESGTFNIPRRKRVTRRFPIPAPQTDIESRPCLEPQISAHEETAHNDRTGEDTILEDSTIALTGQSTEITEGQDSQIVPPYTYSPEMAQTS